MEKFVNSKGRSIIGWDEILEGGLAPNATVMSWRGEAGGIAAAQQSHNVVMTPGTNGLYFDHSQGKNNEPLSIGGFDPLQKTYSYNPTPAVLSADQQKYILGAQANLWTEYIATGAKAEYMVLPRMLALAEVVWTPLANKNYTDFAEVRLPQHLAFLDKNDYNFRVPTAIGAVDTMLIGSQLNVSLKPSVKGAKIYYTIDGYTPRETDLEYQHPLSLSIPQDQMRELQTMVVTPSGKRSSVTHTLMYNKSSFPSVNYSNNITGLKYKLIPGLYNTTGPLDNSRVADTGIVKSFNTTDFRKIYKGFGVIYTGFMRIDDDGTYSFSTQSYDGSVLLIDDVPVVDNDGRHSLIEQGGAVPLQKGFHRFTLKYFSTGNSGTLKVYMTIPGKPKGELSPDTMYN
jgi:hexosaminidase